MFIIILCGIFIFLLFYTLYLYSVKVAIEFVQMCIDWVFLRILLYILIALYVFIPHAIILSLIVLII